MGGTSWKEEKIGTFISSFNKLICRTLFPLEQENQDEVLWSHYIVFWDLKHTKHYPNSKYSILGLGSKGPVFHTKDTSFHPGVSHKWLIEISISPTDKRRNAIYSEFFSLLGRMLLCLSILREQKMCTHIIIISCIRLNCPHISLVSLPYSILKRRGENLINTNQLYKSRYDCFEEETNVPILFLNRIINFADKWEAWKGHLVTFYWNSTTIDPFIPFSSNLQTTLSKWDSTSKIRLFRKIYLNPILAYQSFLSH